MLIFLEKKHGDPIFLFHFFNKHISINTEKIKKSIKGIFFSKTIEIVFKAESQNYCSAGLGSPVYILRSETTLVMGVG